jgi:TatD DNase family protein
MIDTHAHLSDKRFDSDRAGVLSRSANDGVVKIISILSDIEELPVFLDLLYSCGSVYGAAGIHPHDAKNTRKHETELKKVLQNKKIIALGEIGLDYHYDHSPRAVQAESFKFQLKLAKAMKLPVIVHSREAMRDTIGILKEENLKKCVLHCFSGDVYEMEECVEMGYYISFAGNITFENAGKLREVAEKTPLSRLLAETDCPYLAPQPLRGTRNEPVNVKMVLNELAKLKKNTFESIEAQINLNVKSLFGI